MEDTMGLRINTNVPSLHAQHQLDATKQSLDHTNEKLASGSRIIRAMDDASGLAISDSLKSQIRSTVRNIEEANNGIFMLHTADGALEYMTNMVIRMRELSTAAASDTNGEKERVYLNDEVQALKEELDRISRAAIFNGRHLLDGSGGQVSVQVGPNNIDNIDRITLRTDLEFNTRTLGISGLDISDTDAAREALDTLNVSLQRIARARGSLGASEAALNSTIANLRQYHETLSGAFSQIRDADLAEETAEQVKFGMLTQAGVAVLAQANASPNIALKLLSQ
jgi:flagellin